MPIQRNPRAGHRDDELFVFQAADLYGDVPSPQPVRVRDYVPGLAVVLAAALAAGYFSERYGAPLTLMALLIGLALNFLGSDARLAPGLSFASRSLLRIGIVLVGVRVTFAQILALGPLALLALIAIVAATIGTGIFVSRRVGLGAPFGILAGGAVAICGASAAMAFAGLLGERRLGQAQLALTLVGISVASSLAMVLYPIFAHLVGLNDQQAGFLFGASVHDVAQSLGAGYSYSVGAGENAAIVKLTRVALLAPTLAVIALFYPAAESDGRRPPILPWFVLGFFALAGINSTGIIPETVSGVGQQLASGCLACAVAAIGIRSPMKALTDSGWGPLVTIAAASLVAMTLALGASLLLIGEAD